MIFNRTLDWLRQAWRMNDRTGFEMIPAIAPMIAADVEWPLELAIYQQTVSAVNGDQTVFWGPGTANTSQPKGDKAWLIAYLEVQLSTARAVEIHFDWGSSNSILLQMYSGNSALGKHVPYNESAFQDAKLPRSLWLPIFAPHRLQIIVRAQVITDGTWTIRGLVWERDLNQKLSL